MENADRIEGKKIYGLLEQARQERTMLRLNIIGSGYEALTVIIGIGDSENNDMSFIIDRPGSGETAPPLAEGRRCFFEFSGKDKIQYSFKAPITRIEDDCLIMELPDVIERIQRRRHFRVPAPAGVKCFMPHRNGGFEFDVINLSEGGALVCYESKIHDKTILYRGSILRNLRFLSSEEGLRTRIDINSAEIIRINKNPDRGKYDFAIKFADISKQDEERVRQFVYDCQRRELKRRGYMED